MGNAVRWTAAEKEAYDRRRLMASEQPKVLAAAVRDKVVNTPRRPYRSQLEAEYAGVLELRKRAGEIKDYGYERIKIRLPGNVWFTPDWDVIESDGSVSLIETKGFMRESARNKLRAAVELYPGFCWYLAGVSKTTVRLYGPSDVPAIRKVVA